MFFKEKRKITLELIFIFIAKHKKIRLLSKSIRNRKFILVYERFWFLQYFISEKKELSKESSLCYMSNGSFMRKKNFFTSTNFLFLVSFFLAKTSQSCKEFYVYSQTSSMTNTSRTHKCDFFFFFHSFFKCERHMVRESMQWVTLFDFHFLFNLIVCFNIFSAGIIQWLRVYTNLHLLIFP